MVNKGRIASGAVGLPNATSSPGAGLRVADRVSVGAHDGYVPPQRFDPVLTRID